MIINQEEYDRVWHECKYISIAKNHDYGSASLVKFKELGLIIRISDKIDRLVNLIDKKEMKVNEKIEDTVKDIINYCVYLVLMKRGKLIKTNNFIDDNMIYNIEEENIIDAVRKEVN